MFSGPVVFSLLLFNITKKTDNYPKTIITVKKPEDYYYPKIISFGGVIITLQKPEDYEIVNITLHIQKLAKI